VFADGCDGCAYNPEVRYAGLWLRERFWSAVLQRQRLSRAPPPAGSGGGRSARGGGAERRLLSAVRVAVHVRRGDVYYLGPKTRLPHPHWVETGTVLDVLQGVRRALGVPLEPPAVDVEVHTERGWLPNDTAALRRVAPRAVVLLGDERSPGATVEALVAMASADLLVMGSSGFSFWAGLFSCGVKV